jgi:hypothetical protein
MSRETAVIPLRVLLSSRMLPIRKCLTLSSLPPGDIKDELILMQIPKSPSPPETFLQLSERFNIQVLNNTQKDFDDSSITDDSSTDWDSSAEESPEFLSTRADVSPISEISMSPIRRERQHSVDSFFDLSDAGSEAEAEDEDEIFELEIEETEFIKQIHELAICSYKQRVLNEKFPDWQLITASDSIKDEGYLSDMKAKGFYAQLWQNSKTGQVVISCAGTKINHFYKGKDVAYHNLWGLSKLCCDIMSDIEVYYKQLPWQHRAGMQVFLDYLIENNPELFDGVNITFTGHSLGGILASSGCAYLSKYSGLATSKQSMTFENPGSRPFVEVVLDNLKKKGELDEDFTPEEIEGEFINIMGPENWINTACPQFGIIIQDQNERNKADFQKIGKFLPAVLKEVVDIMQEGVQQYIYHNKEEFAKVRYFKAPKEWKMGLFDQFLREFGTKINDSMPELLKYESIAYAYSKAQTLSNATSNVAKKVTDTASEFCDFVESSFSNMLCSLLGESIAGDHVEIRDYRENNIHFPDGDYWW